MGEFAPEVESWTLVPGHGGAFEVEADDVLVYSKLATGRHATLEEVRAVLASQLARPAEG